MTALVYKHSLGFVRFAGARAWWVWDAWLAELRAGAKEIAWPGEAPGEYVPPVADEISEKRKSAESGNVVRKPSGFWTEGDQADLEALTWALAVAAFEHRAGCVACMAKQPCGPLNDALELLLDWRRGRMLLSRAAKVRRRELAVELRRIRTALDESQAVA